MDPQTQIFDRIKHATREEHSMPKDPLAREQEMVIQVARHALTRTIEQYSPVGTDTLPITTAAISRMFADLINSLSSASDIVDVVNRQIEQSGYRLVETRRSVLDRGHNRARGFRRCRKGGLGHTHDVFPRKSGRVRLGT